MAGFLRVWWPFAVGLVLAWLVTRLDRAPLAWGRAVVAWLLTVAVGMALRIAVEGHEFKVAFTDRDAALRGRGHARLAGDRAGRAVTTGLVGGGRGLNGRDPRVGPGVSTGGERVGGS